MERSIENCVHEIQNSDEVTGCLIADKHGLCLTAVGNAKPEYTGIISAFAIQAAKLEPKATDKPVILLENDNRKCLIKQYGVTTGAIFKCSSQQT